MKLHYKEYGNAGPVLVILHGLLGSSQNWHAAARDLATDFRVIIPDLRNHGDSPHGPHSIELMRDDVNSLMADLGHNTPFMLGHSMGGLVAMSFSFVYPKRLRGLIVEDVAPIAEMSGMSTIFEALEGLDLSKVAKREDAIKMLAASIADSGTRQFLLQNLRRNDDGEYRWRCNLPELHRFVREDSFAPRHNDKFAGHTLFIGGGRSEQRIADKQTQIERHFPGYRLEMIADAGHWLHFESPNRFVALVRDFIKTAPT